MRTLLFAATQPLLSQNVVRRVWTSERRLCLRKYSKSVRPRRSASMSADASGKTPDGVDTAPNPRQDLVGSDLLPALLLTNDDGLDPSAAMVLDLAMEMVSRGHRVLVCAPGENNSACGQKISLGKDLVLKRHPTLEREFGGERHANLFVFSVEKGSPSDCVIVAAEPGYGVLARLGLRAVLTLSGVNVGPNMGPDVLYSGTFSAARQAAMQGIPAISGSLASFGKKSDLAYARNCQKAVSAVADVADHAVAFLKDRTIDPGRVHAHEQLQKSRSARNPEGDATPSAVRDAFVAGDVVVNVNVPAEWAGQFDACTLDSIIYRGVIRWASDAKVGVGAKRRASEAGGDPNGLTSYGESRSGDGTLADAPPLPSGMPGDESVTLRIAGGTIDPCKAPGSDSDAVGRGLAAVTTVSTWPATHPFAVTSEVLQAAMIRGGAGGLPDWLTSKTPA